MLESVIVSTAGVNAAEVHVALTLFKYERLFLLQLVC